MSKSPFDSPASFFRAISGDRDGIHARRVKAEARRFVARGYETVEIDYTQYALVPVADIGWLGRVLDERRLPGEAGPAREAPGPEAVG